MELFLNLLWAVIASGAIGVWRIYWLRQKPRGRLESLREWTAIGCALVLLFFVVSLTDDLHAEAMLLDESLASRRQTVSSHHLGQSKQINKEGGPAILPRISAFESLSTARREVNTISCSPGSFFHDVAEGRAPPAEIF